MKKLIFIFGLILIISASAFAQVNGFNFQGRLNDGTNPANGSYDLQFSLFNSITGGTQIGTTIARPNTTLINGVFSVTLDFGAAAFNNPNSIFIEIGVKPNGSPNAFTILGPRQQLTVVPFAVRATNATNADNAVNSQNSQNSVSSQSAQNAANAVTLNGITSGGFIQNSTTSQINSNFNISGNGVIGGTLNVAGNSTVSSNLNVAGNNVSGGNVQQNRDKGGLVKAMLYVNANGTIARCYNGITGSSSGNCGIITARAGTGSYDITFDFQVNDRFVSVTPEAPFGVNIAAGYKSFSANPFNVRIQTYITDVTYADAFADNPFMLVIY